MSIMDWYRRVQDVFGRSHPAIDSFKKQAKRLQMHDPSRTLMQCQDSIAQQHGFNNWHHASTRAASYTRLFEDKPGTNNHRRFMPVRFETQAQILTPDIRCLGFHELSKTYWGQGPAAQRVHTLVIGEAIGPLYFERWLREHRRQAHRVFAWLNISQWPLHVVTDEQFPLVLRLGHSIVPKGGPETQPMDIEWADESQLCAWVNILAPNIAPSVKSQDILSQLLHWLWLADGLSPRTGRVFSEF